MAHKPDVAATTLIITALPTDRWREYRALRLEALHDSPQAFGSSYAENLTHSKEYWINRLCEVEMGRSILTFAERDRQLVGMIGAFWENHEFDPDAAIVVSVYVQPRYRGDGIASMLLASVLSSLRAIPGITKAQLTVNPLQEAAVNLYRRHGFEVIETIRSRMGDDVEYDELVMERDI